MADPPKELVEVTAWDSPENIVTTCRCKGTRGPRAERSATSRSP
jgi:hypothetical protein